VGAGGVTPLTTPPYFPAVDFSLKDDEVVILLLGMWLIYQQHKLSEFA
jgi:hypothetical protein